MEIVCKDRENTKKFAQTFAKCIDKDGAFIALHGAIGAGKTTFTKFLLEAMGVEQNVTSPTFVILNEYHSDKHIPIYHFDLYRLEREGLKTISSELDEYIQDGRLTLIEWADYGKNYLPQDRIDMEISYGNDSNNDNLRVINLTADGDKMQKILNKLEQQIERSN